MAGNSHKVVILQERDLHLLRELAVMRVIDREQAKLVGGFASTTRVNARLLALTEAGYLRRFFWGTVGGARKALYALSPRGADAAGVPYRRPRRSQDQILAVDAFSAHQLEINEVICAFKYRSLPPDTTFIRWLSFQKPVSGVLIPDGYVELQTPNKPLAFFLEVDRGNERGATWQEKVRAYVEFAASGTFARQFGTQQFRTLVITTSRVRLASLRSATTPLTEKIFRFTTFDWIKQKTFWGAIWQKPADPEQQTLI